MCSTEHEFHLFTVYKDLRLIRRGNMYNFTVIISLFVIYELEKLVPNMECFDTNNKNNKYIIK